MMADSQLMEIIKNNQNKPDLTKQVVTKKLSSSKSDGDSEGSLDCSLSPINSMEGKQFNLLNLIIIIFITPKSGLLIFATFNLIIELFKFVTQNQIMMSETKYLPDIHRLSSSF